MRAIRTWICFTLAFHTPIDRISWRAFLWLVARSELYGAPGSTDQSRQD